MQNTDEEVDLSKDELQSAVRDLLGDDVANLPLPRLWRLITVTQHATDVLLNELEERGELASEDGIPIVPYMSDYVLDTILTR